MIGCHPVVPKVPLPCVLKTLKTGDIILFHATNNVRQPMICSYYGHVGIVWVDPVTSYKYLFEANGTKNANFLEGENPNGIYLSLAEDRISRYKGFIYVKSLAHNVTKKQAHGLSEFIQFALKNMYYENNVMGSAVSHFIGNSCGLGTNCGEITYLSLIKLGMIDPEDYYTPITHYLRYICGLTKVKNNYYLPLTEIIVSPFGMSKK
jgi:hypothetical protein